MKKTQDTNLAKEQKSVLFADIFATAWILVVMFAYFSPILNPVLSRTATLLAPVYALMVIVSVLSVALRYLKR